MFAFWFFGETKTERKMGRCTDGRTVRQIAKETIYFWHWARDCVLDWHVQKIPAYTHTHTSRHYNILILMLHLCNSCGLASHVLGGFSLFPEYEIWTQTMMMRNFFIFRLFGYSWSTCARCFHFHFLFSFFCVFICFHYPFSWPIFLAVSMTIVKKRFLFASSPTNTPTDRPT